MEIIEREIEKKTGIQEISRNPNLCGEWESAKNSYECVLWFKNHPSPRKISFM